MPRTMFEEFTIKADTFAELLGKMERWKEENDDYDVLSIQIYKMPNTYDYHANLAWEKPYEEIL